MKTLEDMANDYYNRSAPYSEPHRCQFCGRRYRTDDDLPIYYDGWKVCPSCRSELEEEEESA